MNLYIRLIKWALQAFDIYTMTVPGMVQNVRLTNQARARSKEEIEVLEHFNGIVSYTLINTISRKTVCFL